MQEKLKLGIVGRWQDQYFYQDGRVEWGQHGEFEWGFNQIQDTFTHLLTALCKRDPLYSGITYLAVGAGEVSWDTTPPTLDHTDTELTDETFRKTIAAGNIIWIDPITNVSTGGVPSNKIEITVTLGYTEANGSLREFGLFGGTATATENSGEMVNWISHNLIAKDNTLELQRRIRLEFQLYTP